MIILRNGSQILDLTIDSKTEWTKKLMGEDLITLYIVSSDIIDFQVGDYTVQDGSNYEINRLPKIQKKNDVEYEYEVQLEGEPYQLLDKIVMLNGKSEFSLTGELTDFVDLIISNINEIRPTWTKGTIKTTEWKALNINGTSCKALLDTLAEQFACEYKITNKVIDMPDRVEQATALTFEVGKGKGLYELIRESVDDENTVTRVYGFGSTRNIPYDYRNGAKRLVFENLDGTRYLENLTDYDRVVEKDVVFEDIWPRISGTIDSVNANNVTITSPEIVAMGIDLNDYRIDGQTAKIVFLTGDLMGAQFPFLHVIFGGFNTIILQTITQEGGLTLPSASFYPRVGDKFTIVNIKLPQSFIDEAETKLKTETQRWLDYYSRLRVKYTLTIDARYIRKNNIALNIGDILRVKDTELGIDKEIRVIAITKSLDGSAISAEISNYRDEKFSKSISTLLADTVGKIIDQNTSNTDPGQTVTGARLTGGQVAKRILDLTPAPQIDDTSQIEMHRVGQTESESIKAQEIAAYVGGKYKLIYDEVLNQLQVGANLKVTGKIEATDEIIAWVASEIASSIFATLTATAPLRKDTDSNIVLDYDPAQFEVGAQGLRIKDGSVAGSGGGDILLANQYNPSAIGGILLCSQYNNL